ncbi:hypothetical protein AJ79_09691 [Helicocarpus griseus UAMH5409]|uniref:Bacteriophage T5 Orf172 DNA-binding domain-containing protein n=1 Tax=Helicocarpus griseus UAMH5409 TaxID=1447875 RepID=A0A2B7WHV9_9EURO|nr:hypothetical protein AJ79_09691 [Helicocarpus griseus UAMH5409]
MSETSPEYFGVVEEHRTSQTPKRSRQFHDGCASTDYFSSSGEANNSPLETPEDAIPTIFSPPELIVSELTRDAECLTPYTDRTDPSVFDGEIDRLPTTPDTTPQPKPLKSIELPEPSRADGALQGPILRETKSADCLLIKSEATNPNAGNSSIGDPESPKHEYDGSFLRVEEAIYGPRRSLMTNFMQAKGSGEHTNDSKRIVSFDSNFWTSTNTLFDFNPSESRLRSRRKSNVDYSTLTKNNLPQGPLARPASADGARAPAIPTTQSDFPSAECPFSLENEGSQDETSSFTGPLKTRILNQRCKSNHKIDVRKKYESLDKLATAGSHNLMACIEAVIQSALCTAHRKVSTEELNAWRPWFIKVLHGQSFHDTKMHRDDRLSELREWVKELKESHSADPNGQSATNDSSNIKKTFQFTKAEKPRSLQIFQPWKPRSKEGKSVSQLLEEALILPLFEREIDKKGLIYIYWQPGNFGHLKIGKAVDVEGRIYQWEMQCKKSVELYFPKDEADLQPVQHIFRVEALVHAELNNRRRSEQCSGCKKTHCEWFQVPKSVAVEIVQKWMEWMRHKPYVKVYGTRRRRNGEDSNSSRAESRWMLSAESGEINGLCQPHKGLIEIEKQEKAKTVVRRSTRLSWDP